LTVDHISQTFRIDEFSLYILLYNYMESLYLDTHDLRKGFRDDDHVMLL